MIETTRYIIEELSEKLRLKLMEMEKKRRKALAEQLGCPVELPVGVTPEVSVNCALNHLYLVVTSKHWAARLVRTDELIASEQLGLVQRIPDNDYFEPTDLGKKVASEMGWCGRGDAGI